MLEFITGPEGVLVVGAVALITAILLALTAFEEQDSEFHGDSEDR